MRIHSCPLFDPRGICLLELLTVMAIASMATAGAVWLLTPALLGSSRIESQAKELLEVLAQAEFSAMILRQKTLLQFDPVRGVIFDPSSGERRQTLAQGVVIKNASFGVGGKSIEQSVFYPSGVTSAGSVVLSDRGGRECRVTQGLRGGRTLECIAGL